MATASSGGSRWTLQITQQLPTPAVRETGRGGARRACRAGVKYESLDQISLSARESGGPLYTIALEDGCAVNISDELDFAGGGIGPDGSDSSGEVHVSGVVNVVGMSSADKPTLGSQLYLDAGAAMGYSSNTVPLVVRDYADITVYAGATLDFSGASEGVAIDSGDSLTHTIFVDGGRMDATINSIEVEVEMVLEVEDGEVEIDGDDTGLFHFTALNEEGDSWKLLGPLTTVTVSKDTEVDGDVTIGDGAQLRQTNGTLTVGASVLVWGGTLKLKSILEAESVDVSGWGTRSGILSTDESTISQIRITDPDRSLLLDSGGILYVTLQNGGVGSLTVDGNMVISGGDLWINCDSTRNTSGQLTVNATLTPRNGNTAILHAKDRNRDADGMAYDAIQSCSDGGGDFGGGGDLPPTGGGQWQNFNTIFHVWS